MLLKPIHKLILCSQSPRRLQLLNWVGMEPTVFVGGSLEEWEAKPGQALHELALANAVLKFKAAAELQEGWLLTADTVVGLGDRVLGKPKDKADALAMLEVLSGQTHQVVTAYALGFSRGGKGQKEPYLFRPVGSSVTFRELSLEERRTYVESGSPLDKAGSYGIQDEGGSFIVRVEGSWSNVMGLPLFEIALDLVRLRVACFASPC